MSYTPSPIDTSRVDLPADLSDLLEALAVNAHETWAAQRMQDGWEYGPRRNDARKQHPCLVPYAELPESEKAYDRKMAAETVKAILALGYRIEQSNSG
jgi:hypothetical protein